MEYVELIQGFTRMIHEQAKKLSEFGDNKEELETIQFMADTLEIISLPRPEEEGRRQKDWELEVALAESAVTGNFERSDTLMQQREWKHERFRRRLISETKDSIAISKQKLNALEAEKMDDYIKLCGKELAKGKELNQKLRYLMGPDQ